ncbi:DNA repair protein RadC [Nitrosospira sp. NpAV]|uniref:RadC family protein n=1 Tax=Nitrosospira sp. NpAV TaxID=58133 RepID=UPI0005A2209F|nr:DNA repair protein RadC [Nitrosospira sp. NpAV]KIO48657.1 DNA repair protein [Nitrosospira sp. NpAV]
MNTATPDLFTLGDNVAPYALNNDYDVIAHALAIIEGKLRKPGEGLNSPTLVKNLFTLRLAQKEHEVFEVVFLDTQNRMIAVESMFTGTLSQTSVYPREVLKRALHHNAAALIFAHNHPSGLAEPSRADELLTKSLTDVLGLVDIRVLDHIVVAGMRTVSFAETGRL